MQTLVRTPDRHEPTATSGPPFKPSNRTCLQVAELQEPAKAPDDLYQQQQQLICTHFSSPTHFSLPTYIFAWELGLSAFVLAQFYMNPL